jgi:hypothetical protein
VEGERGGDWGGGEERRDGVLEKGCQVWDIVHQE